MSVLAPLFLATAGPADGPDRAGRPTVALAGLGGARGSDPRQVRRRLPGRPAEQAEPVGGAGPRRGHERPRRHRGGRRHHRTALGVLNTATYTIIMLVAIVTSLMAPPLLRLSMARVAYTEEETAAEDRPRHLAWPGAGRTQSRRAQTDPPAWGSRLSESQRAVALRSAGGPRQPVAPSRHRRAPPARQCQRRSSSTSLLRSLMYLCRVCADPVREVIDLERQPSANRFLLPRIPVT